MPGPPAQVGDGGADRGLGQHPEPEGQCRGRDVVASFQFHPRPDRGEVRLGELPVPRAASQRREQAQFLPVSEHSGGYAEPPRGL